MDLNKPNDNPQLRGNEDAAAPAISVIVPVYHVQDYLRRCLDSILAQDFTDLELILVNDGGNEAETAICEEYAAKDARIVYIAQENRGLSCARNRALDICRGEWILFVDSDDWVDPGLCRKALAAVTAAGADIGVFDMEHVHTRDGVPTPHKSSYKDGAVVSGYDALAGKLRGRIQPFVWNKIYRRDIFRDVRFPAGELFEDIAVNYLLLERARTVTFFHETLYFKDWRPESITGMAAQSRNEAYWQYLHRHRRYEYLAAKYPELLPLAAPDMAMVLVRYADYALTAAKDVSAFRQARAWARKNRVPGAGPAPRYRFWYRLFYYAPVLFAALKILRRGQSALFRTVRRTARRTVAAVTARKDQKKENPHDTH